jgi:hypothetical protein
MASRFHSEVLLVRLSIWIATGCLCLSFANQPLKVVAATDTAAQRQPVLVELFTSEGCSDCPPADALLAQLDATQFVPGAQAIVLSEHVTYWNHLGWRDPFSLDAIDQRQTLYATQFHLDSTYTPQTVVDGVAQFVGSDSAALGRAVAQAATHSKVALQIGSAHLNGNAVQFSVQSDPGKHQSLTATLAEDATRSEVAKGENAGRTLQHVAVVRVMQDMGGHATDGHPLTLKLPSLDEKLVLSKTLRLVVFLTDTHSGHITGVAEQLLTR